MIEAHVAPEIETGDRIGQFKLKPCDDQEHVFIARSYYFPVVHIKSLEDVSVEQLRAEILMAAYAADDRFLSLPRETQLFDKRALDEASIFAQRQNSNS